MYTQPLSSLFLATIAQILLPMLWLHCPYYYTDPRVEPTVSGSVNGGEQRGQYGVPAAYERSFKWKVGHFRNLCAVSQIHQDKSAT